MNRLSKLAGLIAQSGATPEQKHKMLAEIERILWGRTSDITAEMARTGRHISKIKKGL